MYIYIVVDDNAINYYIDDVWRKKLQDNNDKNFTFNCDSLTLAAMMTSSNGNIFRVIGPLRGEFTGPVEFPAQRPVTRSFDVFFDLKTTARLVIWDAMVVIMTSI